MRYKIMAFHKQIFTILILAILVVTVTSTSAQRYNEAKDKQIISVKFSNIMNNPITPWNPKPIYPIIDPTAYIHPQASVIGDVIIGANVMVYPMASIRGDEGMPVYIGNDSNVQDGVVIHGLETTDEQGKPVEKHLVDVNGKKYVYVGENVTLAHQSMVHGPAYVGNDTFIGFQTLVFKAEVGNKCVLEPKSAAIGVTISDNKYIPAGMIVTSQKDADKLPIITEDFAYKNRNEAVVHVNTNLAKGYNRATESA